MTSPSSFNVSGLLGGAAGSIDTTTLISQLMQAASLPQTNLKNQLSTQQAMVTAYQSISSKVSAMQTAGQALTDPGAWTASAATSSSPAVVASSSGSAVSGTTTFSVLHLATGQVSTVAADSSGVVVSQPTNGIAITGSDGTQHQITLTTGTAADVAASINSANVGVKASLVTTDNGQVLQLTAANTGAAGSFTSSGFDTAAQTVVAAQNAQIGVGDPAAGGYTVSSATNTFTGVIAGVTFSVDALATDVTVSVSPDQQSLSGKIQALVDAANAANQAATSSSGQGGILEGSLDVETLQQSILSSVSRGTSSGASLKSVGIDIDKSGTISFDAATFAAAFAADPAGAQAAIGGSFATALDATASSSIDPVSGSITQAITSATNQESQLNTRINDWTSRLAVIQQNLQTKYVAMQTALAKLQSQQTSLTSMINSLNNSTNSSSSSGTG